MDTTNRRSTADVVKDHVRLRLEGKLEEDLQRNYSHDVILLTVNSKSRGVDAIRMSAERLAEQLPNAQFEVTTLQIEDPFALLIWSARSPSLDAVEGADSFVVQDGRIVFHSIHYGLKTASGGHSLVTTTDDGRGGS